MYLTICGALHQPNGSGFEVQSFGAPPGQVLLGFVVGSPRYHPPYLSIWGFSPLVQRIEISGQCPKTTHDRTPIWIAERGGKASAGLKNASR